MLVEKVGPHSFDRWDLEFDAEERDTVRRRILEARPTELGGRKVEGTDTRDGVRFLLEGGFWALVRFSGTEPLVRIYAEAESAEEVEVLLEETRDLAGV